MIYNKKTYLDAILYTYKNKGIKINFAIEQLLNVAIDKSKYDLIYSRFTFHSITNEQHQQFLDTIKVEEELYKEGILIETKSTIPQSKNE